MKESSTSLLANLLNKSLEPFLLLIIPSHCHEMPSAKIIFVLLVSMFAKYCSLLPI
jgi:hypothetical protein